VSRKEGSNCQRSEIRSRRSARARNKTRFQGSVFREEEVGGQQLPEIGDQKSEISKGKKQDKVSVFSVQGRKEEVGLTPET